MTIDKEAFMRLENVFLDEKINRYTQLVDKFTGDNKKLLSKYISRMIDKKLENQKILEAVYNNAKKR